MFTRPPAWTLCAAPLPYWFAEEAETPSTTDLIADATSKFKNSKMFESVIDRSEREGWSEEQTREAILDLLGRQGFQFAVREQFKHEGVAPDVVQPSAVEAMDTQPNRGTWKSVRHRWGVNNL